LPGATRSRRFNGVKWQELATGTPGRGQDCDNINYQRPGTRRGVAGPTRAAGRWLRWKVGRPRTRHVAVRPCRGSRPCACGVHLSLTGKQPGDAMLRACLMTACPHPTPAPLPARSAPATAAAATRPTSLGRALHPGRRRCPPTPDHAVSGPTTKPGQVVQHPPAGRSAQWCPAESRAAAGQVLGLCWKVRHLRRAGLCRLRG
jgi:hypothetical protein